MNLTVIILLIFAIIYAISIYISPALHVIVYSPDKKTLKMDMHDIKKQYPGHSIYYHIFDNTQEFTENYGNLLLIRKKCNEGCRIIPHGNIKYLTENLPLDYFDLQKIIVKD